MHEWKLKSPHSEKSRGVGRWEVLWHVGTTIVILLTCYAYHSHQNRGYSNVVDRMERLLDERQKTFTEEMETLKTAHETDVENLRKDLRVEMYEKRHQYRKELATLEVDYQAAVKIHEADRDQHQNVSKKLQAELDKHAQYHDTHDTIEKTAKSHMDATKESLAKCKADVKQLNEQLKGREGTEVDAAMQDLTHKMDDLMASYTHLNEIQKSHGEAAYETVTARNNLLELYKSTEELKTALESVIQAPNFAPNTPRGPIKEIVSRAASLLDITKPGIEGPPQVPV